MVKLRQTPEDFCVCEIGGLDIFDTPPLDTTPDGPFRVYRLRKKNWDTLALLPQIARRFKIPRRAFGLAGLKDRHAVTEQRVTIAESHKVGGAHVGWERGDLEQMGWHIKWLGWTKKPMTSGTHDGNKFVIVMRDLTHEDIQRLPARIDLLHRVGTINAFDSQRFGSASRGKLPGSLVVSGRFEDALRMHLTGRQHSDRSRMRRQKSALSKAWPNLGQVDITHKPFRHPIEKYLATGDAKEAVKSIPEELLRLWMSAWQSKVWNEIVNGLLIEVAGTNYFDEVLIPASRLLLPRVPFEVRGRERREHIDKMEELFLQVPKLFPTPSRTPPTNSAEKARIGDYLERKGHAWEDLQLRDFKVYLGLHQRLIRLRPEQLEVSDPVRDELNGSEAHKRWRATLTCTIPSGSYATIIVKSLVR